ncbi:MAG: TIGR02206 family membrane protein [Mycobacterium sp.]|nr:TIGR02206 family membrane protein [Mycobacterium sp.]
MPPLASDRFESFTPEHFVLIALFAAVFVGLVGYGRSRGDNPRFRRGFAIAIPCFTVPSQIIQLTPAEFGMGTSLPLQYCDLAWMLAIYALWTQAPWAFALTFFWGLTLTIQGILTPSLGEQFPEPRYFMFWGMHLLTVWAAGYLAAIGNRPTWKLYRWAVAVTVAWAAVVMVFNALTDTNYGYFNEKPSGASLLDVLPGWPTYVLIEIAVVAALWAALTWAFQRRPQRA